MNIVALGIGVNGFNRGGEVEYVQTTFKIFRQLSTVKVDQYLAALLLHVNRYRRIRQADNNPALTVFAAPEINVVDALITVTTGTRCRYGCFGHLAAGILHGKDDLVAFCMGFIRHHVNQVDDHAGAPLCLDGGQAFSHADADIL